MEKDNIPILELNDVSVKESAYILGEKQWNASTLIDCVKRENCAVFDMPIVGLNLSETPFSLRHLKDFCFQMNRVNKTDLQYPIILDPLGNVADGNHRICKAILEGRKTIKAVRLTKMPTPDVE